eukprot:scpid32593/ scgid10192/ 
MFLRSIPYSSGQQEISPANYNCNGRPCSFARPCDSSIHYYSSAVRFQRHCTTMRLLRPRGSVGTRTEQQQPPVSACNTLFAIHPLWQWFTRTLLNNHGIIFDSSSTALARVAEVVYRQTPTLSSIIIYLELDQQPTHHDFMPLM